MKPISHSRIPSSPDVWSLPESTISTTRNIAQHSVKKKLIDTQPMYRFNIRRVMMRFAESTTREILRFMVGYYQIGSTHPLCLMNKKIASLHINIICYNLAK
uniref:Uncharacterized protein n=1 Tax=Opuntia streptacantha TaxID=393608 RepID=A0A7C9AHN2_OPUST